MDTAQRQLSESARADMVNRNILTSFFIIGTIVNLASLAFLFWFRNKPIVAMGQPRLLAVMCVGSLVFIVGNVLTLYRWIHNEEFYEKSNYIQKLTIVIFSFLGDFAVDGILFLKLYRVYKVMRFRRGQTVLPRHIIVPFVVLLLVPLVFSILSATQNKFWDVYLWLHVFTVWLVRVALLVFAWILRNVTESVGDTRRILRYVVFTIIIWSFFSVYEFSDLYENILEAMEYSDAALIMTWILWLLPRFLHSVAPATFLVFPRMYLVWYERVHGHLPDHVQVYGGGNVHVNSTPGTSPGATNANANANGNANGNGNGNADDPLFAAWNDYDYDHGTDDAVFAAGAAASGEMPGSLFSYYGRRQQQRQQQNATRQQQQQQHYQQTTIPDL
mmetsp:Transcript_29038/g.68249  ORF Transcript_29038/g.68249 Transcript_29038/m.68249 type:complete len:388 (+) Transcript_29038:88-1251(+)